MSHLRRELKDSGRGIAGALVFGTPFLLTMETWWLGWTLPVWVLLPAAAIAILVVLVLAWAAGFRRSEKNGGPQTIHAWLTEVAEVMAQALVAAYVVLSLYGIIDWQEPFSVIARTGLMQLIALGLGAALANRLLSSDGDGAESKPFPQKVGLFALGALFFVLPLAPTEEMLFLAAQAGWIRMGLVLVAALLVAHFMLFELEFRGQGSRHAGREPLFLWAETFLVVALAALVSALTLMAFGQFLGQGPAVWVQMMVVLTLPATVGASTARLVMG